MHELGIVFHIVRSVEKIAEENNVEKVKSVTLEIGEVSTVVPSYLTDCWKWTCKRSQRMKDCRLIVENIPALTYCQQCGNTYETVRYGKECPKCHSGRTYLIQGNETQIREIEVIE